MSEHLLEVKHLKKSYPVYDNSGKLFAKKKHMCAVDDMSFFIEKGETYGLVGESGCGKSTTGRTIVGLNHADSGEILYDGKDLCKLSDKEFRPLRKDIQMVFQDTLSALNPRQRIGDSLSETLKIHGMTDNEKRREAVVEILKKVGLSEEHYFRFPHELSGGQVQRLGIAGALIIQPKLIVCDEPVSALDVSIQAQMVIDYWKEHPEMDKNGDGKLQLVYLMGDPGHTASQPRCDYLKSTIEDAGIEIDLLAEDTGMWVTATAKEKMDAWVSKYGDEIECCVAGNDAMALGALSAVEAAGFNTDGEESSKYIPIYGIDALPEILSKIESGEITGSVLQDAKTQGQTIVKMAENLTSGKDAVDGIEGVEVEEEAKAVRVPYQAITKDNLDLAKSTYE